MNLSRLFFSLMLASGTIYGEELPPGNVQEAMVSYGIRPQTELTAAGRIIVDSAGFYENGTNAVFIAGITSYPDSRQL